MKIPNKKLSLREIQLAALEILKKIDEICCQEGLRYWLMYGTLIGAVRHQGFIPWDDDVDIAMPRQDYDRLLMYFTEHAEELKPLVAIYSREEMAVPFLITRVSDTRYRMKGEYGDCIPELGAFIDIYPFDGLGNDLEAAKSLKMQCAEYSLKYLQAFNFACNNRECGTIKKVLKKIRSTIMGSGLKYSDAQSQLLSRYSFEDSKYVDCAAWCSKSNCKYVYQRTDFAAIRMTFEDSEFNIPAGFDAILTTTYGDYMRLPSEEKRVGNHEYTIQIRQ